MFLPCDFKPANAVNAACAEAYWRTFGSPRTQICATWLKSVIALPLAASTAVKGVCP
ncbi:hypothetical protein D3C85_1693670 [compost metagenome]